MLLLPTLRVPSSQRWRMRKTRSLLMSRCSRAASSRRGLLSHYRLMTMYVCLLSLQISSTVATNFTSTHMLKMTNLWPLIPGTSGGNDGDDPRAEHCEQGSSAPVGSTQASGWGCSEEEQAASEASAGPRRSISLQEMWQVRLNPQIYVFFRVLCFLDLF